MSVLVETLSVTFLFLLRRKVMSMHVVVEHVPHNISSIGEVLVQAFFWALVLANLKLLSRRLMRIESIP